MINTQDVISKTYPRLSHNKLIQKPMMSVMKYLLCEHELNAFSQAYPHLTGFDFVEQLLDHFQCSYTVSDKHKERIPSTGKVVIIANHPIGTIDGLALIKLVKEIRSDVKVIANDLLMNVQALHDVLLPVQNMQGNTPKQNLQNINRHLQNNGAVIMFPAGEVSRLRPTGIKDTKWQKGFLTLAKAHHAPILPIYVGAKNSALFYGISMLSKPAASALLVREMLHKKNTDLPVKIGELIPYSSIANLPLSTKEQVKLIKRHLYRIAKNAKPLLATQSAIAPPEERRELLKAIHQECEHLGETTDGKVIFLYQYQQSSPIMRELGRLRELTFRAVGEGTQQRRDVDLYDKYYQHLILWDPNDLEIAGAYRLGNAKSILEAGDALYSQSLFDYQDTFAPYFEEGLELGRSFVQEKYWGKRSLDYLWMGIGAFIRRYPRYRYLFGPVSLSATLPSEATALITSFFSFYFPDKQALVTPRLPYSASTVYTEYFTDLSYDEGMELLKSRLGALNVAIPTLFKQYGQLCEPESTGVRFCGFNIDPDFQNCIDGLVLVDITLMKEKKKRRYLG